MWCSHENCATNHWEYINTYIFYFGPNWYSLPRITNELFPVQNPFNVVPSAKLPASQAAWKLYIPDPCHPRPCSIKTFFIATYNAVHMWTSVCVWTIANIRASKRGRKQACHHCTAAAAPPFVFIIKLKHHFFTMSVAKKNTTTAIHRQQSQLTTRTIGP